MSHTATLPVVRFSLAGFLAIIITFLLFFLMQDLIRNSANILPVDSGTGMVIDFVKVRQDTPVVHKKHVKPPPDVTKPPPPPMIEPLVNPRVTRIPVPVTGIPTGTETDHPFGGGFLPVDGDFLPIMKVTPVYPAVARTRGIEGYTIVEYTVTAKGTTRDIRVIESDQGTIFNRVSVEAAAKFKYKPRVIDGTAVEVHGVQNKFNFTLE